MPLPPGEWKINSNGLEGTLLITGVSPEGLVSRLRQHICRTRECRHPRRVGALSL